MPHWTLFEAFTSPDCLFLDKNRIYVQHKSMQLLYTCKWIDAKFKLLQFLIQTNWIQFCLLFIDMDNIDPSISFKSLTTTGLTFWFTFVCRHNILYRLIALWLCVGEQYSNYKLTHNGNALNIKLYEMNFQRSILKICKLFKYSKMG